MQADPLQRSWLVYSILTRAAWARFLVADPNFLIRPRTLLGFSISNRAGTSFHMMNPKHSTAQLLLRRPQMPRRFAGLLTESVCSSG